MSAIQSAESALSDSIDYSTGVPNVPLEDIELPDYEPSPPYEHPPTYARTTLGNMTWEELVGYLHRITDEESMRIDATQGFELLRIIITRIEFLHKKRKSVLRQGYDVIAQCKALGKEENDLLLYAFNYTRFLLRSRFSLRLEIILQLLWFKSSYAGEWSQGKIFTSLFLEFII
jgi:hypothetical protein